MHSFAYSHTLHLQAPTFKAKAVLDEKFIDINSADYQEKGMWTALLFYPFDFTFVCPTELKAFSAMHEEFAALKTQVLAISTDSHHTHLAWLKTPAEQGGVGGLNMPLVADTSHEISRQYGVLIEDENDDMNGATLRGLFLVDPSGVLRSVQINDDSVGRSVEETLRLLNAFQWADAHKGEACPASWKPGDDTIKADPEGAQAYFKAHF
jgi:alkyl hydroperoxide reductase subunit AhpC